MPCFIGQQENFTPLCLEGEIKVKGEDVYINNTPLSWSGFKIPENKIKENLAIGKSFATPTGQLLSAGGKFYQIRIIDRSSPYPYSIAFELENYSGEVIC
jgi:hypothetical protein